MRRVSRPSAAHRHGPGGRAESNAACPCRRGFSPDRELGIRHAAAAGAAGGAPSRWNRQRPPARSAPASPGFTVGAEAPPTGDGLPDLQAGSCAAGRDRRRHRRGPVAGQRPTQPCRRGFSPDRALATRHAAAAGAAGGAPSRWNRQRPPARSAPASPGFTVGAEAPPTGGWAAGPSGGAHAPRVATVGGTPTRPGWPGRVQRSLPL